MGDNGRGGKEMGMGEKRIWEKRIGEKGMEDIGMGEKENIYKIIWEVVLYASIYCTSVNTVNNKEEGESNS